MYEGIPGLFARIWLFVVAGVEWCKRYVII